MSTSMTAMCVMRMSTLYGRFRLKMGLWTALHVSSGMTELVGMVSRASRPAIRNRSTSRAPVRMK